MKYQKFIYSKELDRVVPYEDAIEAKDAHYIITDEMPVTLNHADGRYYTSKRAYEKAVSRAGCVIVGNEAMKDRRKEFSEERRKRGREERINMAREMFFHDRY
jgi:hypothetical protein